MTRRLYLDDEYLTTCEATVIATDDGWLTLSDTVIFPGGGGQPADHVTIEVAGRTYHNTSIDSSGAVRFKASEDIEVGTILVCRIDWAFRHALMRHHALMHIVNTVGLRRYDGLQTGTQLGPERSRIDFRFPTFDRAWLPGFEEAVNEMIRRALPIRSEVITEQEFRARPELIRTKNVSPPIESGAVRIVEIGGFDAQACGGTHVRSTEEIGTATVDGFDNKGRENKRIYWVLERDSVDSTTIQNG